MAQFQKIEKLLFSAQAIQSIQTVNCGKNMKKMQKNKMLSQENNAKV